MNLSILIPTVDVRTKQLNELLLNIENQITQNHLEEKIEVIVFKDNFEYTIGHKRNTLLDSSQGTFTVYVDDDDELNRNYCKIMSNIIDNKKIDYIGHRISRFFNGKEHPYEYRSIHFKSCYTDPCGKSYRHVSHTNPILSTVSKTFKFPEWNSAEDADWCEQIYKSNLLKKEHYVGDSMYIQHYNDETSLSKDAKDSGDKKLFSSKQQSSDIAVKDFKFVKWISR